MQRIIGNSTSGHSLQHNGDVLGDVAYHITNKLQSDDSETEVEKSLILSPTTVRPLDGRFHGDEQAIAVWLKDNNLRISKLKRAVDGQSLIDRMSTYSVYRTYRRLASRRLIGTTQWISETAKFKAWLEGSGSAELFLVGKVGSGKTILMTTIIRDALETAHPKFPVLSFFFEQPSISAVDLFASLTQQLLRHMVAAGRRLSEEVQFAIQQLYIQEATKPTLEEIQKDIFEPVLHQFPGCAIVIDGIDSVERGLACSTVRYFNGLLERTLAKVLISTRDDLDIPPEVSRIYLNSSLDGSLLNGIDIVTYVDAKLEALTGPGKLLANESLRSLVKDELLRNANGMFLWVVLQVENLFGRDNSDDGLCQTAEDVRCNVGKMPQGLEGIYEQCVRRQTGSEARYTARILRWVCASPETTHIDNVRELLAFDPAGRVLRKDAIPPRDIVLRAATNLVVLDSSDQATDAEITPRNYILPIHSTVRDFVFSPTGQAALDSAAGDAGYWTQADTVLELGGLCAAYLIAFSGRELVTERGTIASHVPVSSLLNQVFVTPLPPGLASATRAVTNWWVGVPQQHSSTLRRSERGTEKSEVEVRLLDFARRNWHLCLRHAEKGSWQYDHFKTLVLDNVDTWHRPWARGGKRSKQSNMQSLFFWAISNDHASLLDLAIEEASREKLALVDSWTNALKECAGVPILHFAVARCSEATIARLLPLCSGKSSFKRCTPLHCAIQRPGEAITELLLTYVEGQSAPYRRVLAKDSNGRSAIHLAVIDDREDIIVTLCVNSGLGTSKPEDLPLLLDHATCTPLYYALLRGNTKMIDVLLEYGQIVHQDMVSGGTLAATQKVAARDHLIRTLRGLDQAYAVSVAQEIHPVKWTSRVLPVSKAEALAEELGIPWNVVTRPSLSRQEPFREMIGRRNAIIPQSEAVWSTADQGFPWSSTAGSKKV